MNKVILAGRLTKDPELRYTSGSNTAVCSFTLAVDRRYKQDNGPEADFIPIVAWQKTAEFCSKYFSKGRKIMVAGRMETRNWEDDKGVKHYVIEVVAEEVDFADGKKEGSESGQQNNSQQTPPPQQNQQPPASNQSQGSYTPPSAPPPAGDKMPWEK